jgi:hypothetical protein
MDVSESSEWIETDRKGGRERERVRENGNEGKKMAELCINSPYNGRRRENSA